MASDTNFEWKSSILKETTCSASLKFNSIFLATFSLALYIFHQFDQMLFNLSHINDSRKYNLIPGWFTHLLQLSRWRRGRKHGSLDSGGWNSIITLFPFQYPNIYNSRKIKGSLELDGCSRKAICNSRIVCNHFSQEHLRVCREDGLGNNW